MSDVVSDLVSDVSDFVSRVLIRWAGVGVLLLAAGMAGAREAPPADLPGAGEAPTAGAAAAPEAPPRFDWQPGPVRAPIGEDLAEVEVPKGYMVLDAANTQRLLEYMQNPVSGSELATIAPAREDGDWFMLFEWSDIGYVKDDEGKDLDADAILDSIRKGTAAANQERKKRGWSTLEVVGWQEKPHYDSDTHNLTWAIIGASDGQRSINRTVKLLGRRGVMTAVLVAPPEGLAAAARESDTLLAAYHFLPGSTYAEYVPGKDKLAKIGLAALIVGGAGAALVKSGLLVRFWKVIVGAVVALGAGIKRVFGSTRAEDSPTSHV